MGNNKILYATKRVVAAVMLSVLLFSTSEIGVLADNLDGQEDTITDESIQPEEETVEEETQTEEQENAEEEIRQQTFKLDAVPESSGADLTESKVEKSGQEAGGNGDNGGEDDNQDDEECTNHDWADPVYSDDGTKLIYKCKNAKCDCTKEESTKPVITEVDVKGEKAEEQEKIFHSKTTIKAIVHVEGFALDKNLDNVDVDICVYDYSDETSTDNQSGFSLNSICTPERSGANGTLTVTWTLEPEVGKMYSLGYVVAVNKINDKVSIAADKYELNDIVGNADAAKENSKFKYTISSSDGTYTLTEQDVNDNEIKWYSNNGNSEDKLNLKIEGKANAKIQVNSITDSQGQAIEFERKDGNGRFETRQITFSIFGLEWTWDINVWVVDNIYEAQLPTDASRTYTVTYTIEGDKENTYTKTIKTFIDNEPPKLEITYNNQSSPTGSEGAEAGFYNNDVTVTAKITEVNFDAVDVLPGLTVVGSTAGEIHFEKKTASEPLENGDIVYTYEAKVSAEGDYHVSGCVSDRAGNNNAEGSFEQTNFTIDKTAPVVAEITFDNNEAKNEKYYKAARTATIKVQEKNFSTDDKFTSLEITSNGGKAEISAWQQSGDGTYTKTVTFSEDGTYSFKFSCKDKATNVSETKTVNEFVIDTKAPEVSVEFDNNSVQNGKYFNSARTAKIKIKDINTKASQAVITKSSEEGLNELPEISGYYDSDEEHEATIRFEKDGTYGFKVSCEDLAGNVSDSYTCSSFVIDTTAPVIDITGVENMSANKGAVEPLISVTDKNLEEKSLEVTLTGSNNGLVNGGMTTTTIADGYQIKVSDIAHEKDKDDLYTLNAVITDLAGNKSERKIEYSVNRFGSVYVLSQATKDMVDGYYVTSPQDVVITEINVDSLAYKEVSVGFEGNVKTLSEGRGYTTSDLVNDRGWHSISYVVGKNNFNNDGIYNVTVFSEDRATNKQSNQSKDAEIEFLMDMTAPSVVVSGIEDNGTYEEANHDFSVNATDTIGVSAMIITLNGEELGSYTSEELAESGGTKTLTIPEKADLQNIEITCSDVAGNVTNLSYNNLLVSQKAEELRDNEIISEVPGPKAAGAAIPIAIAAVASVGAAGAGVGVFAFKKIKTR
ncbi:Ig-like domain (group 3) [Pseudobutyrivibrio sp. JW11]|uniref:Ig-like domain-containing protein n=1 Tax=Pseudobutyrivibrio sp. JW11 TaxID=1855302 RepID=UPI0008EB6807|nr:Ig-like domain-containing protein [Pseudobutyrivibrio sp. JW11]SFO60606.1 Ig-like domain (group 3) [Pseudobutyrivibrio sp. JW11]